MNGSIDNIDTKNSAELRTPVILSVDDDPDISRSIELRLGEYRVKVLRAFFGVQGCWDAITQAPDLIIMDLAMPNGDGKFVLESLRRNPKTAHVPIIILTGMRDRHLKEDVLNSGADQYLTKPIRFDDLLHEISRFITIEKRGDAELEWSQR